MAGAVSLSWGGHPQGGAELATAAMRSLRIDRASTSLTHRVDHFLPGGRTSGDAGRWQGEYRPRPSAGRASVESGNGARERCLHPMNTIWHGP